MIDRGKYVIVHALSVGQRALLQQLLQMRQHELDRRLALRGAGASRSERASELPHEDADDAAQRDADREIDPARADRDIEELGAISDALARVHDPRFGRCIACGEAIPFDRLKLEPWALRCVACEADQERRSAVAAPRATI